MALTIWVLTKEENGEGRVPWECPMGIRLLENGVEQKLSRVPELTRKGNSLQVQSSFSKHSFLLTLFRTARAIFTSGLERVQKEEDKSLFTSDQKWIGFFSEVLDPNNNPLHLANVTPPELFEAFKYVSEFFIFVTRHFSGSILGRASPFFLLHL